MGISNLVGRNLLKLAVSYEWINGMNWFFLCWYKFKKAESYFNNFCMGVVKSGPDSWARGTLKYAVSQWIYELSWIFDNSDNSTAIFFVLMVNPILLLYILNASHPL